MSPNLNIMTKMRASSPILLIQRFHIGGRFADECGASSWPPSSASFWLVGLAIV